MNTFKVENDSSDMTQPDPLPLNDDSVKLEIDETENVPDLQNVMTVKTEIDETEIGKLFTHVPKVWVPNLTQNSTQVRWAFLIGRTQI